MQNPRTVSDTKRAFYAVHRRPIHSIYRRFIEELLVEIHLLRVNVEFRYSPLFALGVVTAFDQFMEGYQPAGDRASIFHALGVAEEMNPQQLKEDAASWQQYQGRPLSQILEELNSGQPSAPLNSLNHEGKYSRLHAVGLYAFLQELAGDLTTNLNETLDQLAPVIKLPIEKVKRDLELYRSNLDKMNQARSLMKELVEQERKRRAQEASPPPAVDASSDAPA
ncbi:photosystem II biogenesis protein Psp29 [Thermosynechococcus sp.]|uniref:photosystem II biogenesis protein Psp29 n=1 Tax=Thermosynechococcus sp. TaxID=2814275 RepID=UPI0039196D33